jgi:hypothetical protein
MVIKYAEDGWSRSNETVAILCPVCISAPCEGTSSPNDYHTILFSSTENVLLALVKGVLLHQSLLGSHYASTDEPSVISHTVLSWWLRPPTYHLLICMLG